MGKRARHFNRNFKFQTYVCVSKLFLYSNGIMYSEQMCAHSNGIRFKMNIMGPRKYDPRKIIKYLRAVRRACDLLTFIRSDSE